MRAAGSFLFTGHGVDKTLAFTDHKTGALSTPDPAALAAILAASPSLQLCFLNGCNTEGLGLRIRAAGVDHVVCWRTETEDKAAKLFATAFYESHYSRSRPPAAAFADACNLVQAATARAFEADGSPMLRSTADGTLVAVNKPLYEFRRLEEPPSMPDGYLNPKFTQQNAGEPILLPVAAGVPLLLSVDGDVTGGAKLDTVT